MKTFKIFFLLFMVFITSGCATFKTMALGPATKSINTSKESIVLMTLKTSNEINPSYQPFIFDVGVRTQGTPGTRNLYSFNPGGPFRCVKDESNEYLLSFQLPPGDYQTTFMPGRSGIFPVRGNFAIRLYLNFTVGPDEVVYVGRVEANNRERRDEDELPAGSAFPLIDQAVTGYGKGTFDIKVYDNYDGDIKDFIETFPFLSSVEIKKDIFPQWKKPSLDDLKRR